MVTTEWPTKERPFDVPFLVRQVELLRSKNVMVDVFHFRGRRNPFNYFKAISDVRTKWRYGNYNLIHAQWGQSALPALFINAPMVTTFRGSDVFGITDTQGNHTLAGKVLTMLTGMVAKRAQAAIIVSTKMIDHLPRSRQYILIPSGVDLEKFSPGSKQDARASIGVPLAATVVLFGGDPERTDKRFDLAKAAVSLTKGTILLLTAKGQPHERMPLYYRAADVLLLTSKHEGSPNVVKEALACNLPVVSVDVGDVKERVANVKGCFVCTRDTPEEIASQLENALAVRGNEFEGRKAVLDLDENALIEKLIDVYSKVKAG